MCKNNLFQFCGIENLLLLLVVILYIFLQTKYISNLKSINIDGWPSHQSVQLDGNFMLEAGNRHFLIVEALVNKTICVTTSDFCFIAKN
jgi:hypothetical protein